MAANVNQTLGDLAQDAISKYLKQATRREKAVLADTDPEELHQMRVAMRRLRTALQVFQPLLLIPKAGREPKVADVARKLGELRDLDVIQETLQTEYLPSLSTKEQDLLKTAFSTLAEQREQTFKQVKDLLKSEKYQSLKKSLKDWTNEPKLGAIAPLPAQVAIPDLVLPLLSHLWLHSGWWVSTTDALQVNTQLDAIAVDDLIAQNSETLHSLRKQIKRVRYQLKLICDLYGDRLSPALADLETMQEALGQLQDSSVLAQFLETALPNAPKRLPQLFACLADERHQAWQQWQTLQKTYLDPATRHQLRVILLTPEGAVPANSSDALLWNLDPLVQDGNPTPSVVRGEG
ncbi:MAG TPA: CHAD domain-containing protein [Trichocoleus sp.]